MSEKHLMLCISILPMEQHSHELDDNNSEEEKHQNDTNWLQMQIFFCYQDLRTNKLYSQANAIWYDCFKWWLRHQIFIKSEIQWHFWKAHSILRSKLSLDVEFDEKLTELWRFQNYCPKYRNIFLKPKKKSKMLHNIHKN